MFACLQRAGGRYPNLTTASSRAQCLHLSEHFFIGAVSANHVSHVTLVDVTMVSETMHLMSIDQDSCCE